MSEYNSDLSTNEEIQDEVNMIAIPQSHTFFR